METRALTLAVVLVLAASTVAVPVLPHADPLLDDGRTAEDVEPVEVIAQLRAGADPATVDRLASMGDLLARFTVVDAVHLRLPADHLDAAEALPGVLRVDRVEPIAPVLDRSRPLVGVGPTLWSEGRTGEGVTVAVVDTGIDAAHPGLADRVAGGVVFPGDGRAPRTVDRPTDADGHGTHVAGVLAGTGEGDGRPWPGMAGVAPGVQLWSLDLSADFDTATALQAFDWLHRHHAAHNVTVVQNSWGRLDVDRPYDPGDPLVRAIATLVERDGLVVVFAASNEGPDAGSLSMEAEDPNVLTVGAVDGRVDSPDRLTLAPWSSRGPVPLGDDRVAPWTKPDVVAPGVAVTSAKAGGGGTGGDGYAPMSGTSMAAPHTAAIVAMVRAAHPHLDPYQVMDAVRRGAVDLGEPGPDNATGWGLVHGARTLTVAASGEASDVQRAHTRTEHADGQLVLDVAGAADDPLHDAAGSNAARAEGTVEVDAVADRLHVRAVWSRAPIPVHLVLEDPDGETEVLPAAGDGRAAVGLIEWPAPGTWTWRLVAEDRAGAAVDYEVTTTVHGLTLAGSGADVEPAAPEPPEEEDAGGAAGPSPAVLALAGLAAAASVLVVARGLGKER